MARNYDELSAALKRRLPENALEALGRATGFIRRRRTVTCIGFCVVGSAESFWCGQARLRAGSAICSRRDDRCEDLAAPVSDAISHSWGRGAVCEVLR